ncbi:50S ribosomal protein L9 [Devosia sp. LC5]|jgi:large subunit ribosomal protein L9|uniref:50S ribosomal protein L9 n=1 Tax=Devosia sp. LC5 TaxID=1502724 RepID=UPI0004E2AAF9|nr:50S ribosomal protein L9 [Devosia sp. LC5]KFC67211.1 50S ribosomal protein L9 [Devosia sp. LC5]
MKVILLERIGRTGSIGDEVSVKDGFARNFLLPQGKALRATAANRQKFEAERAHIEQRNEDRRKSAAGIAEGLDGKVVVIIRQAGETGQLYGSVASRDIVEALAAEGFTVQRSQIDLADPIKSVGVHTVPLNLHSEVAVSISVNVARSEDEAARQSAGEDVTVTQYEDDVEGDFAAGQKDAQQDDRFDDEI